MTLFNFCITLNLILFVIHCAGFTYPQLKLLNIIFRHGDRDLNDDSDGDLTIRGRQRAYYLGEILRAKYGDFLGDIYEPAAVFAHSTAFRRAKLSLQVLLAALYLPKKHQQWHESLAWLPIPFSYANANEDIFLFPTLCPRFQQEYNYIKSTPEYQEILNSYGELMYNLTMLTSVEIKDFMDMFQLFHKIKAMESMNQSLSYWMKDILSNDFFINAVFLQYDFYKFTNWTRKVNGGSLVRKIIDDMIDKIEHNSINRRKIFLYGSHELFIASVLQTLKIWKPRIPQYSSAIVIELREHRDKNFVKILYYDGLQSIPKEMQIPGCPSLCPISKFIQLISDQLPNYNEMICDDKPIKL